MMEIKMDKQEKMKQASLRAEKIREYRELVIAKRGK
jgi:hypothetical protein